MITLISSPQIDWNAFICESHTVLSRSPTRSLDQSEMVVGGLSSYIATIGGFLDERIDPRTFITTNDSALEHLYFTFLCNTTILEELRIRTDLKILATNKTVFLLSGTLLQYKRYIVECSKEYLDYSIRYFFNYLFLIFKKNGLEEIWNNYSKKLLLDGTFEFI